MFKICSDLRLIDTKGCISHASTSKERVLYFLACWLWSKAFVHSLFRSPYPGARHYGWSPSTSSARAAWLRTRGFKVRWSAARLRSRIRDILLLPGHILGLRGAEACACCMLMGCFEQRSSCFVPMRVESFLGAARAWHPQGSSSMVFKHVPLIQRARNIQQLLPSVVSKVRRNY